MAEQKKIHMMGIGGSGMAAVSLIAQRMGYAVSGCDLESQTAYGENFFKGHSPSHIKDADFVVVTPAIFYQNPNDPELKLAKEKGILYTWQEFLGKFLAKEKILICIAGTHGKSTTTAMAGKMMIDAGLDPTVLVGARVPEWNANARFGKGKYFLVEADEFNNNFLNYSPDIIVINNIEFDHPDFFKNENEVNESFKKFIGKLKKGGIIITQKDSLEKHFNLKVFGEHNQKNANMVFVLGKKLGIDENAIVKSLENFKGIGRRMELIAERDDIKIFDDYAHHPTAIKTTIAGLRKAFPKNKIWAIDEPHGFARTAALISKYNGAFYGADRVIIGPIFKARDAETFEMSPEIVAKATGFKNAIGVNSFSEIKSILAGEAKPGDIILVMGAGKSYLWARDITEMIPVSFKDITTFHIGGKIKKYFAVSNEDEIREAVSFAKNQRLPIFIIGGGSDILANDKDFEGVVIKYIGENITDLGNGKVRSEAGLSWDKLVGFAVEKNLQGIECLSGIPGTVGASPIQNIGAYGQELKDSFESLTAFDIEKEETVTFSKEDCVFGYRESIFKRPDHWQKYIIVNITLLLNEGGKPAVKYDSLKDYLAEKKINNPTLSEVRRYILTIRAGKFENPKEAGNAGSFFKNPELTKIEVEKLQKKFPDMPARIQDDGKYKCSAGWFIEAAGWKGKRLGNAGVSPRHALILINPNGKAKASEVLKLSEAIIKDVNKKFGVKLEKEVQMINF